MMSITEPATLATDYLLAAFAAMIAAKLAGADPSRRGWAVGFAATSVAAATGGTVHGFRLVMPSVVTDLLWVVSLEALVVASFAIVTATWRRGASVAGAACAVYAVWLALHPLFVFAIVAYGTALIVLAIVHVRRWTATRASASAWILGGIAVSVLAGVVQQGGWDPAAWFNHNDLYHVVQAIALWMLYNGARQPPTPKPPVALGSW